MWDFNPFSSSFHRQQSEEVKVIQGRIGYILEGKDGYISEGYASKGHTLRLPMGKIHSVCLLAILICLSSGM